MKIKVSEATLIQLDWLVAKSEGREVACDFLLGGIHMKGWHVCMGGNFWRLLSAFTPSTDPAQAYPIIFREEIGTKKRAPCFPSEQWEASGSITAKGAGYGFAVGPTPLIAAMRCFVASKLGNEVEVPDELCTSPS